MDTKPDLIFEATNNNNNNNKRITPLETDPKSNLKLEAENKINKKQQTTTTTTTTTKTAKNEKRTMATLHF